MIRPRVVVCGGGLAGIAAACEASLRGADVTLVERRPFLGGKAYSFTDESGTEIDNGQHVFLGCCVAYRNLLDLIGATAATQLQRALHVPVRDRSGTSGTLSAAPLPAPFHIAPTFLRYPLLSWGEKLGAARALAALARLGDTARAELDAVTFAEWLTAHGQSPRAIERFWDLIVLPTCNDRSDRVSARLAAFVFHEGFFRTRGGSAIGWSRVGLTRLIDPPTRRFLAVRGARLTTGVGVERVVPGEVTLTDGSRVTGDRIIVAVPPARAAELCPEALPAVPELGSSPIVNVHLWFDREVMREPFVAVVDSPAQWVFNRTAMAGSRDDHGQHLAVSISGARAEVELSKRSAVEMIAAEVGHLFPAARSAKLVRSACVKEPDATFAAAPGQAARRAATTSRVPGVILAGAWTDTGWPATMEGAVRSGMSAARAATDGCRFPD